jgi:hypothetical protein
MAGSGSYFGRKLYGLDAYSRNYYLAAGFNVQAGSRVVTRAQHTHSARAAINAQSAVAVQGRLLWEHVTVAPCDVWTSLVVNPCCPVPA